MEPKLIAKDLLKGSLAILHGAWRRRQLQQTKPTVERKQLVRDLRALGVEHGDAVFLHSSLKSLGFVEGGPSTVLGAILEVIGTKGTLVVPTYYQPGGTIYATCRLPGYVFDPAEHGTNLGALPAAFLSMPGIARSLHPTHSVSALGRHAAFITEAHHRADSIFGLDSPWGRFLELDGKVLGLGVSMGPVTFYHVLEDQTGDAFPVPVRMPACPLQCRDQNRNIVEVAVRPLDPAFMERRIDHPGRSDLRAYFWAEFQRAGLLTSGRVGEGSSWFIRAQPFLAHLRKLMHEGITIYATAADLANRPIALPAGTAAAASA